MAKVEGARKLVEELPEPSKTVGNRLSLRNGIGDSRARATGGVGFKAAHADGELSMHQLDLASDCRRSFAALAIGQGFGLLAAARRRK